MKNILLSCCLFSLFLQARSQVIGRLVTAGGQPIPSANVLLLRSVDSGLVKAALSDENGGYRIERVGPGRYFIRYSSVGYQMGVSPAFELGSDSKDLGAIVLQTDTAQLGSVVVRAQKPLFQQQVTGTTVNVENSILTKGSSALEVLERSPGVVIDRRNNAIALNGNSGVLVLLNGKLLRLSMDQVVSLLNSMPADNIEKIELLTSPPANYDADGNAGMINIVLKKSRKRGTNGSLSASTGYGYGEKASASLNLTHNSRVFDVYGSYAFSHDRAAMDWHAYSTERQPLLGGGFSHTDVLSDIKPVSNSHNVSVGADARLNSKTTIGGSVNYNNSHVAVGTHNTATFLIAPDSPISLNATISGINQWNNIMASAYVERKIREGERITFDMDYLDFNNRRPTDARSSFLDKHGNPAGNNDTLSSPYQKGISNTHIQVGVGKLDYVKRLSEKVRLETGAKGTYTRTSSLSRTESWVNGAFVSRDGTTTDMVMKEAIGAAYASVNATIGSSGSLTAGLRYEYSDTRMDNPGKQALITERKLGKLFPSVFFSQKLGARSELQLSYTTRISRPSYNDLTSYVIYTGPSSIETGNPLLKPTITNTLKLGYVYRGYSFSVSLSRDDHPIVRYQLTTSADGMLLAVSPVNMEYQNSLLFQIGAPVKVTDWWSMNWSFNAGWRRYKEDFTPAPAENTWFGYSGNMSQTFRLPKGFSAEVSGWYNSRLYDGSKKVDGFGALNAGIKKELKNNGGSFQLFMTDIFRTTTIVNHFGTLTEEAFSVKSRVPYRPESARAQVIRLSYTRTIGGGGSGKKGGAQEERERVRE
ncbi:MAG: TonB-dependent receptor [Bacteroidetes bacterium]|nr:TonB-dependent receptor [Bacteroidota bacterium]